MEPPPPQLRHRALRDGKTIRDGGRAFKIAVCVWESRLETFDRDTGVKLNTEHQAIVKNQFESINAVQR